MRIRTIKPEFWQSETMNPLSSEAKLLAIGLLNFCDDEGFFWANPILIRAAIFPFVDESTTIRRWLDDLSRAGYICLGKRVDDGRAVGRVINFKIHQKIDRPKPSIIKQNTEFADASTTHRRLIDDASPWKGKERKGRESTLSPPSPTLEKEGKSGGGEREVEVPKFNPEKGLSKTMNLTPKPVISEQFGEFKSILSAAFKRPDGTPWNYPDECALVELSRRPQLEAELRTILEFKKRDPQYFPQSISRLLAAWDETLDRARNKVIMKPNGQKSAEQIHIERIRAI